MKEWAPLQVAAADAAHGAVSIRFPGAVEQKVLMPPWKALPLAPLRL